MNRDRQRVKEFVSRWKNGGDEDSQCQKFWEDLVESVLGVKKGREWLDFEKKVKKPVITNESGKGNKRIDVYLPHSKTLIEQKSSNISLDQQISRGKGMEPLDAIHQALAYYNNLKPEERGQYMLACNFKEFIVVDHSRNDEEPIRFTLESLIEKDKWKYLRIVLNGGKTNDGEAAQDAAAKTASEFVKQLYALLKAQYTKEELTREVYHSMNVFCVRVVFCLYADDAGVFGTDVFKTFLETFKASQMQEKFYWLFDRMNHRKAAPTIDNVIKAFPYVNGGLFRDNVEVPLISDAVLHKLKEASWKMAMPDGTPFRWGQISPTNFGCIFESTIDPDTRRTNGMHYTSPENIRKVIKPLFLDSLEAELSKINNLPKDKQKEPMLDFQRKLRKMTFLDPACGSGNFLTETFRELRRLEMKAINAIPNYGFEESEIRDGDTYFKCPYVVDIDQFYGIEINDFAVEVAKAALWISHCQMIDEAEETFKKRFDQLPLSNNSNIHRADALVTDWRMVTPHRKADYVLGNPPFEGSRMLKKEQKASLKTAMREKIWGKIGNVDFVCGWYAKAAEYMQGAPNIRAAFVSTNSITQGDHVPTLWKKLSDYFNIQITFAWKSFVWESEAKNQAAVNCVIIGFCSKKSKLPPKSCRLYEDGWVYDTYDKINAYLLPAEQMFINSTQDHIQGDLVPKMQTGSMPNDEVVIEDKSVPKGKRKVYLLRITKDERADIISKYPELKPYLPRILGGDEFISGEEQYCIWINEDNPESSLRNHPALRKRFVLIGDTRSNSTRKQTKESAATPWKFGEVRQPSHEYLLIPATSSENRNYIPMGYVSPDIICSKQALHIDGCPKWVFAVLESRLHMAWVKAVSGRLEMRYRYSSLIVYNNFPWPNLTDDVKERLNETAASLLAERNKELKNQTYDDIYDKDYVPLPAYAAAVKANDKAVFEAYSTFGISQGMSDEEIAIALLKQSVRLAKQKKQKKNKRHG